MFLRDDDDNDKNENAKSTKKRKSETIPSKTKTLFNYFSQKTIIQNDAINRRISGSHFFRAAHIKPSVFPVS